MSSHPDESTHAVGQTPRAAAPPAGDRCTIGIDVGTTSVKAVAVDAEGRVVARARVPHRVITPTPEVLEHDASQAWRRGPRRALAQVAAALDGPAAGVVVTAMVPSITAVDRRGIPRLPGLLYGDVRARVDGTDGPTARPGDHGGEREEGRRMLEWAVAERPGAAGYWPCQAVATHALCGVPAVDSATATSFGSLLRRGRWDGDVLAELGVSEGQLSTVVPRGQPAGTLPDAPTVVGGGSIDAFCEQIVSGAVHPGDVLAIFGATLIVWSVAEEWVEVAGLTSFPSWVPDRFLIGGPSNAGALFGATGGPATTPRAAPAIPHGSRSGFPTCGGSGPRSTTRACRPACTDWTSPTGPTPWCGPPTRRRGSSSVAWWSARGGAPAGAWPPVVGHARWRGCRRWPMRSACSPTS